MGDFHLDGEIYLHGVSLQDLSRMIKKPTKDTLLLEYHIYDWVAPMPFLQRIGILAMHKSEGEWDNVLQPVKTDLVTSMEELMEYHTTYRAFGYEGTMLRFGNDPYQDDTRSRSLLKIKEFHDEEFKVVGIEEGKPYIKDNHTYRVPVWVCTTNNGLLFNVTAAGTMQEKDAQWQNAPRYIGKALTVKYHYLSREGIPQLPVALRWKQEV